MICYNFAAINPVGVWARPGGRLFEVSGFVLAIESRLFACVPGRRTTLIVGCSVRWGHSSTRQTLSGFPPPPLTSSHSKSLKRPSHVNKSTRPPAARLRNNNLAPFVASEFKPWLPLVDSRRKSAH
eukprot:263956-Amorphochlora_amoeboformis.AAC.2